MVAGASHISEVDLVIVDDVEGFDISLKSLWFAWANARNGPHILVELVAII